MSFINALTRMFFPASNITGPKTFRKRGGEFLVGTGAKRERVDRFTDQQKEALNQLLSQGMANQDPQAIEDRYTKLFEEQTVPGIAQQFTNMGAQRSGAFQSALGRAGGDLASQLAALRSGRGMQQTQMGLTPQFNVQNIPGSPGLMQKNAGPLTELLGHMFMGSRWNQGKGKQQQQQGSGTGGYMKGQPQGFNSANVNPAMLKMLMGMLL